MPYIHVWFTPIKKIIICIDVIENDDVCLPFTKKTAGSEVMASSWFLINSIIAVNH